LNAATRLIFAALVAGASALAAGQAEDPQLRKEIQRLYGKWDRLVAAKDLNGMMAMLDPSFVSTDKNGKTASYGQFKKDFGGLLMSVREPKSKSTVNQIQVQGDEVVAWVSVRISFHAKQGTRWVPVSFDARYADTAKRIGGEWKFVAAQELP